MDDKDQVQPSENEQINPREQLARDISEIGRKVSDYFYSEDGTNLKRTLPVSDKGTVIQRFALHTLLSETRARVEGWYQYPPQREHNVHMWYFTARGDLPEEIRALLQEADSDRPRFVVHPREGMVSSECQVVDITDTERNKRRILFVRPGSDGSSLSMDVLDVTGNIKNDEDEVASTTDNETYTTFQGINHNLGLSAVSRYLAEFCR